jgi:hypothetical protein
MGISITQCLPHFQRRTVADLVRMLNVIALGAKQVGVLIITRIANVSTGKM